MDPVVEKFPGGGWEGGGMKVRVTRAMRKEMKCLEARRGKDTLA